VSRTYEVVGVRFNHVVDRLGIHRVGERVDGSAERYRLVSERLLLMVGNDRLEWLERLEGLERLEKFQKERHVRS